MKLTLRTFIFLSITASYSFSSLLDYQETPTCWQRVSLWIEEWKGHVLSEEKYEYIIKKALLAQNCIEGNMGIQGKKIIQGIKEGKKYNLIKIWRDFIEEGIEKQLPLRRQRIIYSFKVDNTQDGLSETWQDFLAESINNGTEHDWHTAMEKYWGGCIGSSMLGLMKEVLKPDPVPVTHRLFLADYERTLSHVEHHCHQYIYVYTKAWEVLNKAKSIYRSPSVFESIGGFEQEVSKYQLFRIVNEDEPTRTIDEEYYIERRS